MKALSILISAILYHETLGCSGSCPVSTMIPLEKKTAIGFSPFWSGGSIFFSDFLNPTGTIYCHDTKCNETHDAVVPDAEFITAIVPLGCKKNEFLITAGPELKFITWDEKKKTACTRKTIFNVNPTGNPDHYGLCTMKTDPKGLRVYFTAYGSKLCGIKSDNPIYSYSKKEGVRVRAKASKGVNGYAFNPETNTLYTLNPCDRTINSYDWCPITGDLSNHQVFMVLEMDSDTFPAGLVIDVDGNMYTAIYGGGVVYKIDPCKKRIVDTIEVDAKYIQSLTLGGPNLDELWVTSSTTFINFIDGDIPKKQPCNNPNGGNLFKIENFASPGYRDKKLCH